MSETGLRKITIPNATEIIAERFDNILELMHPNAFVYGGAVRDIVAGLPLEGDIDIVASGGDYDYCYSKITACGKWRPCFTGGTEMLIAKVRGQISGRENKAIKTVNYFETFNNRRVELIKAEMTLSKNITSSMEVVKTVDLACCGLAMDIYGNIYEVVDGAYQDCMDRVLRLHNLESTTDIEVLKGRIAKLENRGWTSRVNIDKAMRVLKKIAKAAEKEQKSEPNDNPKRFIVTSNIKLHSEKDLLIRLEGIKNKSSAHVPKLKVLINNIMKRNRDRLPYHISSTFRSSSGVGNSLSIFLRFDSLSRAKAIAVRIESELVSYFQASNDSNLKAPVKAPEHTHTVKSQWSKKHSAYVKFGEDLAEVGKDLAKPIREIERPLRGSEIDSVFFGNDYAETIPEDIDEVEVEENKPSYVLHQHQDVTIGSPATKGMPLKKSMKPKTDGESHRGLAARTMSSSFRTSPKYSNAKEYFENRYGIIDTKENKKEEDF